MGDVLPADSETASLGLRHEIVAGERSYLMVIENQAAWTLTLPSRGGVTIGRGQQAGLRIDHPSISREHAQILVEQDAVRVHDLESHNGTRVNGETIVGAREVTTGDVITIGEVVIIVHTAPRRSEPDQVLDEASWRRRLTAEVERAVKFRRPLAVLAIAGVETSAVTHITRAIDVLGRCDHGEHLLLLPETEAPLARQLAGSLPRARVGIATCPFDAIDADNLLIAARAALRIANPIALASDTGTRMDLGDREVLVCHPAMVRVFDLLKRLAAVQLPVLITGETGVGKENAAFAVHHYSTRAARPFVALNCAALPEQLVESQLFGHDKGAFTGAIAAREGLLESVDGGTLFLDEVGELSLPIQAKLLRAIETQKITRLGEHRERAIDVRFVAATNRNLEADVEAGRFRRDLFFRLGGAKVFIPPLRDRASEIAVLFRALLSRACTRAGRELPRATPAAIQLLLSHAWPGNVRELVHVAEYLAATVVDDQIEVEDLPIEIAGARTTPLPVQAPPSGRRLADELAELERLRMSEALAASGGVKTRAAATIGMPIRTFNMKLKQYGLG